MYEFLEYRVEHAMTADPVSISPSTTIAGAEAIFEEHDFDALPVLDESGRVVGMLSKLDLCKAFAFGTERKVPAYQEIVAQPVDGVMRREFASVRPTLPLPRVLQAMIDGSRKSVPVLDGDDLVGILVYDGVLHAVRRAAQGLRPEEEASWSITSRESLATSRRPSVPFGAWPRGGSTPTRSAS